MFFQRMDTGPREAGRLFHHDDLDLLRQHGGVERDVVGVAEHELERVRPGRQLDLRLGLAGAEMQVVPVGRDRVVGVERLGYVDEEVVVAARSGRSPAI